MSYVKMLALAAGATMALMAFAVGSASATTLEIKGVTRNESIKLTGGLAPETSMVMRNTSGSTLGSCSSGSGTGSTATFTGASVIGAGSESSYSCTAPVTVDKAGTVSITHISGTTNGTVISSGAEVTISSGFGTLNCKSNEGTHVGVLTGKASGQAVLDVSAVVNCGFLLPSAKVEGTGVITSPEGLGVSA